MDLATIVDEYINSEDLERFRRSYEEQTRRGAPSPMTVFNYAHSLVKSSKEDVKTGIFLLEGLLKRGDSMDVPKRDCVFYLAIAHTRIKEYDKALEYVNVLLSAEDDNRQCISLKELIEKRMRSDGLLGLAVLGFGGVAAIAAGIGAAVLLKTKR